MPLYSQFVHENFCTNGEVIEKKWGLSPISNKAFWMLILVHPCFKIAICKPASPYRLCTHSYHDTLH